MQPFKTRTAALAGHPDLRHQQVPAVAADLRSAQL